MWVGTYRTVALAALACDVGFFYTNKPSTVFNLEYSEGLINVNCKPRSAYDNLNGGEEKKSFIKVEANALINLIMSSQDEDTDFHGEDVAVPPLILVRQRSVDVAPLAFTIVQHFWNQVDQLREFMEWLMVLSNKSTKVTHQGHVQTIMQQPSEEIVFRSDVEEAPSVEDDQFFDGACVGIFLKSLETQPFGVMWLNFLASILPLVLTSFSTNKPDFNDPSSTTNEASFTKRERGQSSTELATNRQKVNQPSSSIELDPEQEDLFTATPLDVKYEEWKSTGYEMGSRKWRKLPPFLFLPDLDPTSFKKYSICGHDILMCLNISTMGAKLVVFNPLTGKKRSLPPLLFPRHPMLLHILVDFATKSYRVIVAGSSRLDEEHLSKKMEVFDSRSSKWEEMHDIPRPEFGLNDYQRGVCANGILYFISFLEGDGSKGVVAFDVENGKWLPNMTCPIPHFLSWKVFHLVKNNGELYLFYEQHGRPNNKYCIDMLELSNSASEEVRCLWRNVITVNCERRFHGNPEYMCVGFREGKLCILTLSEAGL